MAQDDDLQFQSILDELRKAQEIEEQNVLIKNELEEHSESIESLEEQTTELSEKVGSDDIEKNVIDKNKLPATLSSAEKKRYQNIGKAFIDGAGSEFKRILKASKFKSMMSTVKEKFQVGVNRVKSAIKKAKKAGGFLAKLLLIAGLLGTIFYLFKDKIKDAIPNISGFIESIFEKAKKFIGGLVENGFSFISDGAKALLGESVLRVIGYLKETLQIFFRDTLPQSITELYVNILSLFSDDAESMQKELENDDSARILESQSDEITREAQKELDEDAANESAIAASAALMDKTTQNYESLSENQLGQLQVATSNAQFAENRNNEALINELNSLIDGEQNIVQLINEGQVDAKQLFENIRIANQDGQLSREEAFKALQNSISDEAERAKLKFKNITNSLSQGTNTNVVVEGSGFANAAGSVIETANQYRENANASTGGSLQALIDVANRDKESHDKIAAAQEVARQRAINNAEQNIKETNERGETILEEHTKVTLNATKVISESLQEAFVDLTAAIKKFLNGDDISEKISTSLQSLNTSFTNFFNEVKNSAKIMLDQLSTVASYFVNFFGKVNEIIDKNPSSLELSDDITQESKVEVDGRGRPIPLSSEFIVNVDVKFEQQRRGEQAFLKDVVSIDLELNQTLEETNEVLTKINNAISNVNMESTSRTTTTVTVDETKIEQIVNNYVKQNYTTNVNNSTTNVNNTFLQNNEEIINEISKNVTSTIINDQEIVNEFAQNIFNNESIVNNVSTNVTNNIANNTQLINNVTNQVEQKLSSNIVNNVNNNEFINNITTNIANNTELINNVTNQVEQKLSTNVVNNVNVVEHRDNSSIVEIVDKEGRTNTITLVDKQTNDAELNVIRNDIRKLAVVASQNREQITRNSLQVSKIVNIGNVNAGQSEPIILEPLHALEV